MYMCSTSPAALTRGPGPLLPSDSAPVLQYGSGPSSDFLAKISGVDNSLFLCNTRFYFPLPSLLLCKSDTSDHPFVFRNSSVGSILSTVPAARVGFQHLIYFFNSACTYFLSFFLRERRGDLG
jgi:hypothetical protein